MVNMEALCSSTIFVVPPFPFPGTVMARQLRQVTGELHLKQGEYVPAVLYVMIGFGFMVDVFPLPKSQVKAVQLGFVLAKLTTILFVE